MPPAGSLKPYLDVIPAAAYQNPTWKGLAYFGRDLLVYGATIAALIAVDHPLLVLPLVVLATLAATALFIVGHDAAHGALFRSRRLNGIVGRIAMLPGWHVYEGWVLGHNRIHHPYTVRQGYDFVWHPYTPEQWAAMTRWQRLRHRVEWSWPGAGLYYLREVWWQKMIVGRPPARWVRSVRRDRMLVLVVIGAAAVLLTALGWRWTGTVAGALWLPTRVLVLPFLGFCFAVGSLVHIHHIGPEIRWWERAEWTKEKGQIEGTTVLRAPRGANFFLHWIMIHVPHHVDVRIPMYHLEQATDAIAAAFPGVLHDEPLRFRDFMANSRRCKLYDFDAGRWLTYAEADAEAVSSPGDPALPSTARAA
jgi:omega-6 fatty acid desaturase (delta-12 desaturase)